MEELVLYGLFFLVAFLYASVGHGGASGYLAVMAIVGFSSVVMKPTALLLNLLVSMIAFVAFYRAKHFKATLLWPLIAASIPFSYLGSILSVSEPLYKQLLGVVLLISVFRLLFMKAENPSSSQPGWFILFFIGGGIGLVSGIIGMGGGILLSPILLLMGWSSQKQTAAICSLFIFFNSLAGMVGQIQKGFSLSPQIITIIVVVLIGGWFGAYLGAEKFKPKNMKYILATVLILAVGKLFFVN